MTIAELKENEIGNVSNIYLQAFGTRETEMFVGLLSSTTSKCFVVKNGVMPIGLFITKIVERNVEIITIAIDSNYRGQGLSSKCIEFVVQKAKNSGYENVFFEMDKNNITAIEKYSNLGFEIMNEKNTIKGSQLVVMYKSLK
ncbi:MAG: GNAT family N-acetyltransferase [Clostridia bacterium]